MVPLCSMKTACLLSIWSTTVCLLNTLAISTSSILPFKIGLMLSILSCSIFLVSSLILTYQSSWLGPTLPQCSKYDGPLPERTFCGRYIPYLIESGKFSLSCSISVAVCSTVDNLQSLMPIWILGKGVDQQAQMCLDTLQRHRIRYRKASLYRLPGTRTDHMVGSFQRISIE